MVGQFSPQTATVWLLWQLRLIKWNPFFVCSDVFEQLSNSWSKTTKKSFETIRISLELLTVFGNALSNLICGLVFVVYSLRALTPTSPPFTTCSGRVIHHLRMCYRWGYILDACLPKQTNFLALLYFNFFACVCRGWWLGRVWKDHFRSLSCWVGDLLNGITV